MTATTTHPSVADYVAADRSEKSAIRNAVDNAMRDAIRDGDMVAAAAAMAAMDAYRNAVAAARRSEPTRDDYVAMVAARVATLRAAADAIVNGSHPGGVPSDITWTPDDIAAAIASDTVTTDDDTVAAIAADRVARSVRRPLRDYIADAMAATGGDYVSVSDIRNAIRATTNGDYVPSRGAIAAAITSDTGVSGVAMVAADGDRPLGARYVG